MTLASTVFCQIGMVMNCRTDRQSVFAVGLLSNKKILFGILVEICLICAVSYVPFLQMVFNTAPIRLIDWAYLIMLPFIILFIEEARKAISRKIFNKKGRAIK